VGRAQHHLESLHPGEGYRDEEVPRNCWKSLPMWNCGKGHPPLRDSYDAGGGGGEVGKCDSEDARTSCVSKAPPKLMPSFPSLPVPPPEFSQISVELGPSSPP